MRWVLKWGISPDRCYLICGRRWASSFFPPDRRGNLFLHCWPDYLRRENRVYRALFSNFWASWFGGGDGASVSFHQQL